MYNIICLLYNTYRSLYTESLKVQFYQVLSFSQKLVHSSWCFICWIHLETKLKHICNVRYCIYCDKYWFNIVYLVIYTVILIQCPYCAKWNIKDIAWKGRGQILVIETEGSWVGHCTVGKHFGKSIKLNIMMELREFLMLLSAVTLAIETLFCNLTIVVLETVQLSGPVFFSAFNNVC